MRTIHCLVLLSVSLLLMRPAFASEPQAATRTEVIEAAIGLLDDLYVIPETAERVAEMLRSNLAAGLYDTDETPQAFAAAITRDLLELTRDQHLRMSWGEGGEMAPRRVVRGGSPAPGGGTDGGVFDNAVGIPEAKMLSANVGYIDIRLFVPLELQQDAAVAAMATVADADAVIFDLRMCMGGAPEMVHFITSYFFPPEPKHLLTYYHGHTEPDSAFTLAEVPGQRLPDADVWILTSAFTGSGCEEFSYNLKHHGRATLVGQTTAGAGHGGGVHALPAGFNLFVPDFRPVHPVTGTGWEGVGVLPHVECEAEQGLPLTHKLALEAILKQTSDEARRNELGAVIASLDAKLAQADQPREIDPGRLAEYAGVYEQRTIFLEEDGLWLQRVGGPKLLMVPGDDADSWSLKRVPQAKLNFVRGDDGRIQELRVLGMQGVWEVSKRN